MRLVVALLRASLVIGAVSLPVVAQTLLVPTAAAPPSSEPVLRPAGGLVMTGITLTHAQQLRIRAINARYAAERDSLAAVESADADSTIRTLLVRNIDRLIAEERLVLTPAQRAQFDRNVADIRARRRELTRRD
jgi:Spy/CpxP family protein refolding chaperone